MKSIELFAGAGGLAIATANAGFDHEAVLEWNENACATIRRNKAAGVPHVRDWEVVQGDVSEYDFKRHAGSVEFVSGGPPCQPFSVGGKHRGVDDARNMFPHAVRAVREIQPKAFLFENVKGLLRKSFANYYAYIIHQLTYPEIVRRGDEEWTDHHARLERAITSGKAKGLRYNVVYQLLNSADYGVPQRRERVLIVGIRADLGVRFSFPTPTHEEDALVFDQWVTGSYWERHKVAKKDRPKMPPRLRPKVERLSALWSSAMLQPWRTVRDAISDLPRIAPGQTCEKFPNHFLNPGARAYAGHNGSPMDEPAKTLKAGDHGVPGGENMLRLADGSVRYFSVRECARLQTFPDEWVLEGSWTESMRQLGNAVPVRMAEVVATDLRRAVQRGDEVMTVIRAAGVRGSRRVSRR
ncbi:MAG: DNA cytosine methyltransferase [Phycisphaeraceae bacterium]|nr:DNA cytosine methyltransferase [Phycisphaeraceae bacterium]